MWQNIGPIRCPIWLSVKVSRAWRETTPACSGLTRLVRAGNSRVSRHDSGANRERARITWRAQNGSVHMQPSLPSSSYPARSILSPRFSPWPGINPPLWTRANEPYSCILNFHILLTACWRSFKVTAPKSFQDADPLNTGASWERPQGWTEWQSHGADPKVY